MSANDQFPFKFYLYVIVAFIIYLLTTNWVYSIVTCILLVAVEVILENQEQKKEKIRKATRVRAKAEKAEKALTPAMKRLREARKQIAHEKMSKPPNKKKSLAAKKAQQTRRKNEARARAKELEEMEFPDDERSALFEANRLLQSTRKSKGLVDYAHAITSAWCPVCGGNMEGGPGGRRRWWCPRCGQMYDSNGNAVN